MRATIISTVLLVLLSVIGCKETKKPTAPILDPAPTINELILANVDVFLIALEDYASENSGLYPINLYMQNAAGNTVTDFLPDGSLLANPVTGALTEPVAGSASNPGQVGYMSSINPSGLTTGYRVDALGEDGNVIFELQKDAL